MGIRVASPTLVGRMTELATLENAYRDAEKGRPHVVLVEGDAGIGKSRLIAECLVRVRKAGGLPLVGRCADVEGGLPFGPMVEVLRELIHRRGLGGLPRDTRRLSPLLPELQEQVKEEKPVSRTALFDAITRVLTEAGSPLAIVIEDIHWSDRSTREFVKFLVDRFTNEQILVILSLRTDEVSPATGLARWLGELKRSPALSTVELTPLDRHEAARQIEEITGVRQPREVVDEIYKRSQGNPFFTEELLAAGADASPSSLPSLADLFLGRVASLDEDVRTVLRAVAVAELSTSSDVLAEILGAESSEVGGALRAAVANHVLVRAPGDRYAFRHALLRDLFYEELTSEERRRYHGAFAAALERLNRDPGAVTLSQIAHHWWEADEPVPARAAAFTAADAAEASLAYTEAMQHLIEAAELSEQLRSNDPPLDVLLERAAAMARAAGEWETSVALLRRAVDRVDRATDPLRAADLMEHLAWWEWWALGRSTLDIVDDALELVPSEPPSSLRARLLRNKATQLESLGRFDEFTQLGIQAVDVAHRAGDLLEYGKARILLATSLGPTMSPDLDPVFEDLELVKRHGSSDDILDASVRVGNCLLYLADLPRLLEVMSEAVALAGELGIHPSWPGIYLILTDALFLLGRWDEAERFHQRTGTPAGGRAGAEQELAPWWIAIARGRWAEVSRNLDTVKSALTESGWDQDLVNLALAAGLGHLWSGDLERARAELQEGLSLVEQRPELPNALEVYLLGLQVAADRIAAGTARPEEADLAELCIERARELPGSEHDPMTQITRDWCEAEYSRALARNEPELWGRVADGWAELQVPWYEGWARWRQGEALLGSGGSRKAATDALARAYQLAADLGAVPLMAHVQDVARRARLAIGAKDPDPVRLSATSPIDHFRLTPRELEVLRLVAEGRSNPEIAGELFISAKTASVHVSHILEKLGVSRRVEAAAMAHSMGLLSAKANSPT